VIKIKILAMHGIFGANSGVFRRKFFKELSLKFIFQNLNTVVKKQILIYQ
jgi:hypothetical protein